MYSYIKGTLEERGEDLITVDNNGIGFEINMPLAISSELGGIGDSVKVYLYQSVSENDIALYGFTSREQKDMFLRLLTVSKIGPKVAAGICAQLSPEKFAMTVIGGNVTELTRVKGLGKKTSERIIVELRDKLKAEMGMSATGSSVSHDVVIETSTPSMSGDAVAALMMLGYGEDIATDAVSSAYTEGMSLEELIKTSLKKAAGSKFS